MTTRSATHDTFVVTRTYPFPPERVFVGWSDQATKARWFGSTNDKDYSLDFRVGGLEINRGGPHDVVYTFTATYNEIVPNERIVYSYTMDAGDTRISVSVTTVEFVADGDGTTVTFTEQGVFLDGMDQVSAREAGSGAMLDALGTVLS